MPLVGFTKNVGGWPLSAASSARLAFRIVMVAFEAWLKGWRSGMIRTPKRNVESSNLAGTSELDVILAHVFLVEVRGRGIWSRAGEQVKICPYHLRLDFLASEFQVVFFSSVNFAYYSMSDNDFISTLFPGQGVLYLGWLGPLITPFPCLPLSKLDCSTCIFSSSCMLSCDTSRENRTRPQSGQVSLAEVWAFGWSIRSSLQCFVESDLICSRFEGHTYCLRVKGCKPQQIYCRWPFSTSVLPHAEWWC